MDTHKAQAGGPTESDTHKAQGGGLTELDTHKAQVAEADADMQALLSGARTAILTHADARSTAKPAPTQAGARSTAKPAPTQAGAHSTAKPAPTQAGAHSAATPAPTQADPRSVATPAPTQADAHSAATPAPTQAGAHSAATPAPTQADPRSVANPAPTQADPRSVANPAPTQAGARSTPTPEPPPTAILPGAFNPLHEGHRRMAKAAADHLGEPVAYELCIRNVDKPPLNFHDMWARREQFSPTDDQLWLTNAATFVEKARAFGAVTFVVGADTMRRIADPKYYPDGNLDAAVEELADAGCRFLVFGRVLGDGEDASFVTLDDLSLPARLRDISTGVSEADFRADISSTALRAHRANDG